MSEIHSESHVTLVAGGAGFLGAHLCRRLLAQGHRVICMDSFLTGPRENVACMLDDARFMLIHHDIINPLPKGLRPTQIYNLACAASPRHYQADPIHTVRTCVQGALNLLELATASNARILQASTSEVYGGPQVHPQVEGYHGNVNPVGLRSCYDEGKRCAETLFTDYARQRHTSVKIARIFNTYGPGMAPDDGRVVSNFICQALAGEALTIYGDGSQTRSLCYVDDMIDGLVLLMNSPAGFQGPVNLGNTEEVSVLDIARRVCSLSPGCPQIEFQPLPSDDPVLRCPDIELAKRHLSWQPTVSLDEGLARTYAYFAGASCRVHEPT
ncbi:SDR family oxidoreductase [Pusillimonas sp. SM2304]|uniref:UDP-glucuronic acid decarboxylase family protein n=1 Tax=Pusillimonas sp. SM2304 TaxID=3073241 RepID=UPI0028760FEB|nr:UDP-glucuronic acid decarboxylase family protein [Pusillimonas sp. SM2304]MDS1139726.1 SDR family oxidoreductase [Pusillimonas sp. SM2304]